MSRPPSPALPWHHHDMESFTVCSEDGRAIAFCNSDCFTDEENEEHAERIIIACNSQAALVDALRASGTYQERCEAYPEEDGTCFSCLARAALALIGEATT